MHIITGLVLAGVAGKLKSRKSCAGLPCVASGPLYVAHAMPGRVRFVAPILRGTNPEQLPWLKDLRKAEGVVKVNVNPVSGSIVITYREGLVDAPCLFGALARLLGLEEALERPPAPVLLRELRDFGGSLNRAVYEESNGMLDIWTLVLISLLVLGGKKILEGGWTSLPAGFTLVWWALNGLTNAEGTQT